MQQIFIGELCAAPRQIQGRFSQRREKPAHLGQAQKKARMLRACEILA